MSHATTDSNESTQRRLRKLAHRKLLFASATLGAGSIALLAAALLIVVPVELYDQLRSTAALLVIPIVVAIGLSYTYLSRRLAR